MKMKTTMIKAKNTIKRQQKERSRNTHALSLSRQEIVLAQRQAHAQTRGMPRRAVGSKVVAADKPTDDVASRAKRRDWGRAGQGRTRQGGVKRVPSSDHDTFCSRASFLPWSISPCIYLPIDICVSALFSRTTFEITWKRFRGTNIY